MQDQTYQCHAFNWIQSENKSEIDSYLQLLEDKLGLSYPPYVSAVESSALDSEPGPKAWSLIKANRGLAWSWSWPKAEALRGCTCLQVKLRLCCVKWCAVDAEWSASLPSFLGSGFQTNWELAMGCQYSVGSWGFRWAWDSGSWVFLHAGGGNHCVCFGWDATALAEILSFFIY